jgi:uncharacterized membrane protein
LREIPVPEGARALSPVAINDAGEVAGVVIGLNGQPEDAFVWSETKGLRRSGPHANYALVVTGINSSGTVTGYTYTKNGADLSALAWNPDQGFVPPDGAIGVQLVGINDFGSMVGSGPGGPVIWDRSGGFISLPRASADCTAPAAINNDGDILIWFGNDVNGFGCYPQQYQIWRSRGDTVDIPPSLCCSLDLRRMNARGDVIGTNNGYAVRLLRDNKGHWEMLGAPSAMDINDRGDAAVSSYGFAYVWIASGELRKIPLLKGATRAFAIGINNHGDVVGMMH